MTPRPFLHTDPGTPESEWLLDDGWDRAAVADDALFDGVTRLVVLAAHPDDETLGAGGLMALAAARGLAVDVIVATDGEASHPDSPVPAEALGRVRREESRDAARHVAPRARVRFLGLPDGGLSEHRDRLRDELDAIVGEGDVSPLVAAPWEHDGHPDHDTLGAVARELAGPDVLRYPVWAWHWGRPDEFPWDRALAVPLDAPAAHAKRAALTAHASQIHPLVAGVDRDPLLGDHLLRRHRRLVEVFLTDAPPASAEQPADAAEPFDAMFEAGEDPWHDDTFYESRKRDLVVAALCRPRYAHVLEIGCSTGTLGARLAERADAYVGLDVSPRALHVARARHGGAMEFVLGSAPDDVPDGPFDLVVLSEIGYFLRADALLATLRRARAVLAQDGEIVLVHWRHPTEDIPLDGPLVHGQARDLFDLPHRLTYADDDFLLDTWASGASPAEREGLA